MEENYDLPRCSSWMKHIANVQNKVSFSYLRVLILSKGNPLKLPPPQNDHAILHNQHLIQYAFLSKKFQRPLTVFFEAIQNPDVNCKVFHLERY